LICWAEHISWYSYGDPINQPLAIPDKLQSSVLLAFDVIYLQEPVVKSRPLRFDAFEPDKRQDLVSEDFTQVWALTDYCTVLYCVCGDNSKNTDKEDEENAREVQDDFDEQDVTGADDLLCSDGHSEGSILDQDHTVLGFFGLTTESPESPNDN